MIETKEIKLDDVAVVGNFRRHFDAMRMAELTASVAEFGVLEPILVRANETAGDYFLIAGERRLRAAKGAGLKTIPARIMDVDENAAAEIQLLENLHREDLGPVDEAQAIFTLMQAGKTVEELADRIDKSVAYVYRAVKLVDLPKAALDAISAGTLTAAHGHQILRAPAEKRDELAEFAIEQSNHRGFTAFELRNHIEYRYSADLAEACFPKGKPYAGEMACTGCPFNSGNQGQLFDGAEKGKCSNPECFKKKTGTFMEEYSKSSASDYPGLQYLGVQSTDYSGGLEGIKRARVMGGTLPREVSKIVKEKPEKFGWCVIAPRGRGEKPTTTLVCLDKKLLDGVGPRATGQQEPARRGVDHEKEDFIGAAVERALQEAVADTIEPRTRFDFTEDQWAILAGSIGCATDMRGKADRNVAQALLIHAVFYGQDIMAACKALGINHDKVSAAATKAAEKEWASRVETAKAG